MARNSIFLIYDSFREDGWKLILSILALGFGLLILFHSFGLFENDFFNRESIMQDILKGIQPSID
jgi:hypothetical protein